ncbi:MAG TPA: response regulator, partial [Verrucomicrobiae bacterium]|nr:response regulator [Verrucomicrobiae bacterium]
MPGEIESTQLPASGTKSSLGFVLVVDDEEQNRTLLCDSLEARGYEVAEAKSGMEAFEKIAVRPPDVVLLDVMMPQMDGFEVCRRLKTDSKTEHIPVLMVTALSERKERLMGIAVGANDFLNKPVDIQDVVLRVGNAVYTKHLHDQLRVERE